MGLNRVGSIRLSVNPAPGARVTWRPLQDGAATAEKSPVSIARVGTKLTASAGLLRSILPW